MYEKLILQTGEQKKGLLYLVSKHDFKKSQTKPINLFSRRILCATSTPYNTWPVPAFAPFPLHLLPFTYDSPTVDLGVDVFFLSRGNGSETCRVMKCKD